MDGEIIQDQTPLSVSDPVTELIDDFFAARRSKKASPHTTAAYQRDLAGILFLLADVHGVPTADLTGHHLARRPLREAFGRFSDTHASASVNRCWSTWNQFMTHLVAEEIVEGNPMAAIHRPARPERSPKPLDGENTPEDLLQATLTPRENARHPWPERDLAVIATLLVTGLRSAELLALRINSIQGLPGERRIHVIAGKGGQSRSIPIEESLHDIIESYLTTRRERLHRNRIGRTDPLFVDHRGEPLQRGGLQYLVKTTLQAGAISDRRRPGTLVHALRHTYATRLAEGGASASEIMALLGHKSLTTSQSYIEASTREQRQSTAATRTYRVLDDLSTELRDSRE